MREGEDPEHVHRMRVAARRVRVAFDLFGECLPQALLKESRRRVRRLTRALGAARDADVQIHYIERQWTGRATDLEKAFRPGIARLHLRLMQHRRDLQPGAVRFIDRLESSGILQRVLRHLERFREPPGAGTRVRVSNDLREEARARIEVRVGELLAFEPFIEQPERVAELHGMRIAAKRLRYTVEAFRALHGPELGEPLAAVVRAQTLLGDIHDADVWIAWLPEFLERERERTLEFHGHLRGFASLTRGIAAVGAERGEFRGRRYARLLVHWKKVRQREWLAVLSGGRCLRPAGEEIEL